MESAGTGPPTGTWTGSGSGTEAEGERGKAPARNMGVIEGKARDSWRSTRRDKASGLPLREPGR